MVVVTSLVGVGLAFLASGVVYYSQENQVEQIKDSFKRKIQFNHPPCFIDNTAIIKEMKEKLKSQHTTGMYYLLEGPRGSGKTTAVKAAAKAIGENIVYVAVDEKDFGISLANALSIDLGCKESPSTFDPLLETLHVKKECPKTPEAKLQHCLNVLEVTLKEMKEKRNPAPILIIDNVNYLVEKSSFKNVAIMLQAFAKRMADEHLIIFYFVSEGKVFNFFNRQPAATRMVAFPHDKWGFSDESAVDFLVCRCPRASKSTITKIVDIVGGHFNHLVRVSSMLKRDHKIGVEFEDVKNELFIEVVRDIKFLMISETPPKSKTGRALTDVTWSLVKKMLVAPNNMVSLKDDLWKNLPDEDKNKLATAYIFDVDWIKQKITFQNTLVHSYFKEVVGKENNSTDKQQPDQ